MGFFDFATNIAESKEIHNDNNLKTHYYKTRYNNIKQIILSYAQANKLIVKSEDDVHGEIFLQANNRHIIVSIVQVSPFETAVDVKVQTYRIIGLYKPMKEIILLYRYIGTKADFKGVGLHP